MSLRNEILKIQHDEQQKVNAENTEAFKHIVECIDEDLKRFAVNYNMPYDIIIGMPHKFIH